MSIIVDTQESVEEVQQPTDREMGEMVIPMEELTLNKIGEDMFDLKPSEVSSNKRMLETLIEYAKTKTEDHSLAGLKWALRELSLKLGTPPITTDFGVFPSTIPDYLNGKVGFRCNTLQDFVDAAIKAKDVNHSFIRKYSERFLMDNVKYEFQRWFDDLHNVWESSVDDKKKGWSRIV